MNCKILTIFLILTLAVSSCAFSGCLGSNSSSDNLSNVSTPNTSTTANNTSAATNNTSAVNTTTANNTSTANTSAVANNTTTKTNTSVANSSNVPKSSGLVSISEKELRAAAAVTTNYVIWSMSELRVIQDMTVTYNQSTNTIMIAIVVSDSTHSAVAEALAYVTLQVLNEEAQYYNNSIKSSDSNDYSTSRYGRYRGGLYDECNVIIGVAPLSKADDYYVFQYIPAGTHNPISLLR